MNMYTRTLLSLIISMIISILLIVIPLPWNDNSYIMNPSLDILERKYIYWSCVISSFILLVRETTDNYLGTIITSFLGPITLLSLLLIRLSLIILPDNIEEST